jgi:hypothetical protein
MNNMNKLYISSLHFSVMRAFSPKQNVILFLIHYFIRLWYMEKNKLMDLKYPENYQYACTYYLLNIINFFLFHF